MHACSLPVGCQNGDHVRKDLRPELKMFILIAVFAVCFCLSVRSRPLSVFPCAVRLSVCCIVCWVRFVEFSCLVRFNLRLLFSSIAKD